VRQAPTPPSLGISKAACTAATIDIAITQQRVTFLYIGADLLRHFASNVIPFEGRIAYLSPIPNG
jgi:hypothetical protein